MVGGVARVCCDHYDTEVRDLDFINPRTGRPFGYAVNPCTQRAAILFLTASEDEQVSMYAAWAACAEHAPETAHEAASGMSADEYVIVNLGVGS